MAAESTTESTSTTVNKILIDGVGIDLTADTVTSSTMLNGKTAHDSSGAIITGNIPTRTSANLSVSGPTVTASAGYYATTASTTVSNGTLSNIATGGVTYTESIDDATIIPAEGALYIDAGWIPNTKITLSHLIPDDTSYTNAGNNQILANYEAYDTNGKKLIGTIATITPAFTGGIASVTNTSNAISTNMSTTTTSSYYIDATASAKATRTAVTYNGAAKGYVNISSGANASSSNTSDATNITATRIYIPAATCTITGGGLSGGDLSVTANYSGTPTVTISNGSETNMSNINIGSKNTTTYPYYFKINSASSALSGTTTVSRAAVTRAAITDQHSAGYLEAKSAATVIGADSTTIDATTSSPTVTVNAGSNSTYIGLKAASRTYSGGSVTATASGSVTTTPSVTISGTTNMNTASSGTYYFTRTGSVGQTGVVTNKANASRTAVTYTATAGYQPAVSSATTASDTATATENSTTTTVTPTYSANATIYIPTAVGSVTMTQGTGACSYSSATNVTASTTNNSGCSVTFTGSGSVSATAKITTAGYTPTNTSFATGSSTSSNTANGSIYINGVTIAAPDSGTRYFDITIPNGSTTETITFRFTVDSSGNTTIEGV